MCQILNWWLHLIKCIVSSKPSLNPISKSKPDCSLLVCCDFSRSVLYARIGFAHELKKIHWDAAMLRTFLRKYSFETMKNTLLNEWRSLLYVFMRIILPAVLCEASIFLVAFDNNNNSFDKQRIFFFSEAQRPFKTNTIGSLFQSAFLNYYAMIPKHLIAAVN